MRRILIVAALVAATTTVAFAQPAPTPTPAPPMTATPAGQQDQRTMQAMEKMADTVTRAAETCDRMMGQLMAAMPYMMAAVGIFGLVLFVDLVLLAVLEVLWIKDWRRRLKGE